MGLGRRASMTGFLVNIGHRLSTMHPKKECSSKQPTVKVKAPSRDAYTLNHLVQIQFTHEPQVLPGRFVHACLPHHHRVTNICDKLNRVCFNLCAQIPLIAATSCLHHRQERGGCKRNHSPVFEQEQSLDWTNWMQKQKKKKLKSTTCKSYSTIYIYMTTAVAPAIVSVTHIYTDHSRLLSSPPLCLPGASDWRTCTREWPHLSWFEA